ncbi:hypothetical protein DPSP01_007614 [Paraphaeosphaeria sporulosa]
MFGVKLFVGVAAVVGVVVAAVPEDSVCATAPAVTTTVTVTECGQVTTPAAHPSESQTHSTASPPVETSWLPSSPAPAPVPASGSPASPAPAPPASSDSASGPSESAPPAPPVSSGGPSGSEPSSPEPTPTATDNPTPSTTKPGMGPTNAGSLPGVSLGMGSLVVAGMAINAAVAVLV